jgi:ABC-type uncharacterized transport system auxiliary subunit
MRLLAAAGLVLLLAACASEPVPAERYYRPVLTAPAAVAPLQQRLLVEHFDASGLYVDRALLFRSEDGSYRQFHYHSWIQPPADLLSDLLVDYLRAAFGAPQVFTPDARVDGDLRLRARLRRLEQLRDSGPQRAALGLEFMLSDRNGEPLGFLDFEQTEACAGPGPGDCQQAYAALLGRAYAALTQLIEAKARALPPHEAHPGATDVSMKSR